MDRHEHRGRRSGSAGQAAERDARYSERDGARWSGRLNGRLLAEVAGLTPGRALDVGCGEGAGAIWLARSGWTVTAIDVSEVVAVSRARQAAERVGAAVEWVCGDALRTPFPAGSSGLVSMQYPALPKAAGCGHPPALSLAGQTLVTVLRLCFRPLWHVRTQVPAGVYKASGWALRAAAPRLCPPRNAAAVTRPG